MQLDFAVRSKTVGSGFLRRHSLTASAFRTTRAAFSRVVERHRPETLRDGMLFGSGGDCLGIRTIELPEVLAYAARKVINTPGSERVLGPTKFMRICRSRRLRACAAPASGGSPAGIGCARARNLTTVLTERGAVSTAT